MTPKSLLRHPEAVDSLDALSQGAFREILPDEQIDAAHRANVERVIVTSGKVYYELLDYRRKHGIDDIPVIRVEQLYPFPSRQLADELAHYPNLKQVIWCQEEARNQGAWSFVEPQLRGLSPPGVTMSYAGRAASASTAPGYYAVHMARQAEVITRAFAMADSSATLESHA
jgi:2-oxoglutarate dehydrogenase E1 component